MTDLARLLDAIRFSADRHRDQRRRDAGASPYINHPIEVATLLATIGGIDDVEILQAAILHDTIEDTETTADEIESFFGRRVREVVVAVTDDKALPKAERKRLQVEHAPHLSREAQLVKLADKMSNVRDVAENPPPAWPMQRRIDYVDWADRVIAGLRGANGALEEAFDETIAAARLVLGLEEDGSP